jgi:hypothetical protein
MTTPVGTAVDDGVLEVEVGGVPEGHWARPLWSRVLPAYEKAKSDDGRWKAW